MAEVAPHHLIQGRSSRCRASPSPSSDALPRAAVQAAQVGAGALGHAVELAHGCSLLGLGLAELDWTGLRTGLDSVGRSEVPAKWRGEGQWKRCCVASTAAHQLQPSRGSGLLQHAPFAH